MTKYHKDLKMSLKCILERYCIIMLVGGLALAISGCDQDDITLPAETTSPLREKSTAPGGKNNTAPREKNTAP